MAALTAHLPSGLPVADRAMLVRERLVERLRARWFVPVTVVSAPAGYGKTTLLTQAIADNAAAPVGVDCWLACGPSTITVSALGEALCQAVEVAPGAVSAGSGGEGADMGAIAGAVADAMWRRSPQPVALIVDDVHEIPAGSEAARLLDTVLASLPTNGHLVLVGRGAPPLRLARLELEGRVTRLGQDDLAFTDAEVAEFATLRRTSEAQVAACGGWPALAELFANARPGVASDHVGQEILQSLPGVARRAVALLAHLGSFDDDVARAVLGPGVDPSELLTDLPLVTREARGEWHVHSLWRSLTEGEVTADQVADARRRAGAVLREAGLAGAAVRMFIDAEAWDALPAAVADALGVAHPPVARDVLAEWFTRLPAEVQDAPAGRLLTGVLALEADPDRARRVLEECATGFRASGNEAGEIACLVQLGQMAWWSEDTDALVAAAARGFELEAAGSQAVVPLACLARALMFDIANDSRSMLAELDRILPGSLNDAWWGIVCWTRAIGLLELGQTAEALEAADQALVHAELLHAPLAQTTRLQALWYQGRTIEVRDALPGVLRRIEQSGYRERTALVAAQCSVVHALLGQGDEAADYLAEARTAAETTSDAPLVDTNVTVAEAAVAVVQGDEVRAADVLTAYAARHPVRQGLTAAPQQRHLALFYVLVPSTRPIWDGADLGPVWAHGRELARAVVAVREGRPLPATTPALGNAALVQAHLPPRWVAELAVAAIAEGRDDGWQLLDASWSVTRPAVADLARGGPWDRVAREALARLATPPARRLELHLLGPIELLEEGLPVSVSHWRRGRVRALLAHLALHGTVSRGQLADDLWPELGPEAQSRNLRVTLTYLLQVLEPDRGQRDTSFFIRQHGDNLSLHAGDWLAVDMWDFDAHCRAAIDADRIGAPAAALDHGLRAVELWRDDPTELTSQPWAAAPLEQRQRRFAVVATRTGELLVARGESDRALALAERALALDPWHEAAHRLVVAVHVTRQDELAARRALRRYRDAIAEFGVAEGEATLMVERLLDSLPPGLAWPP